MVLLPSARGFLFQFPLEILFLPYSLLLLSSILNPALEKFLSFYGHQSCNMHKDRYFVQYLQNSSTLLPRALSSSFSVLFSPLPAFWKQTYWKTLGISFILFLSNIFILLGFFWVFSFRHYLLISWDEHWDFFFLFSLFHPPQGMCKLPLSIYFLNSYVVILFISSQCLRC